MPKDILDSPFKGKRAIPLHHKILFIGAIIAIVTCCWLWFTIRLSDHWEVILSYKDMFNYLEGEEGAWVFHYWIGTGFLSFYLLMSLILASLFIKGARSSILRIKVLGALLLYCIGIWLLLLCLSPFMGLIVWLFFYYPFGFSDVWLPDIILVLLIIVLYGFFFSSYRLFFDSEG